MEKLNIQRTDVCTWFIFDHEQRGITSGQFAAWYDGEELIGSGVIG